MRYGGTETYLCETLRAIAKQVPQLELVVFTNRENDRLFREILSGYSQLEFQKLNFFARNRYMRIIREQIELPLRAKLAHLDLLWSPGYTMPLFSPCSQVVTIHDMQYKRHPEDLKFQTRLITDILVRVAARRSCRVIAVSEFSKKEIVKYAFVSSDAVDVIYEGVDPAFAKRAPEETIKKNISHIVDAHQGYILCVANSYPHKNVHGLVEAFGRILSTIHHQLVILGRPGLGENSLQVALETLPEPGRVTRLSHVSKDELIALYQGTSLFILPSLYEGFGLPVLEAMMAGVPVLTTRCGSIPEVGGDSVLYFDHNNQADLAKKICEMLDLNLGQEMAWIRRAALRAAKFTWERTAEETVRCFEDVL